VFVVWDEDSYIPNIAIAPSVIPARPPQRP